MGYLGICALGSLVVYMMHMFLRSTSERSGINTSRSGINFKGWNHSSLVVGNSAYPLRYWLIKPLPSLSQQHKYYNYCISRGRVVVEITFEGTMEKAE